MHPTVVADEPSVVTDEATCATDEPLIMTDGGRCAKTVLRLCEWYRGRPPAPPAGEPSSASRRRSRVEIREAGLTACRGPPRSSAPAGCGATGGRGAPL